MMLDRALKENHYTVALGVVQIIGERAEVRGVKGSIDALVRALNSQDRRVALAAADALSRLPGNVGQQMSTRIIEVYRAVLAGAPPGEGAFRRPKALIADPDAARAELFSDAIRDAGFDPVITRTGRETLRRLNEAADIDVIWVSNELPYPMLPEFLAQARSDYRYGRLPMFIAISQDVNKLRLPEMSVRLEQADHLVGADVRGNRKLKIDLSKMPLKATLKYDAFQLSGSEQAALDEWLATLTREQPLIRATIRSKLIIRIGITDKDEPGLEARLRELVENLPQVNAIRDPATVLTLEMDGSIQPPELLMTRLANLERDFGAARNRVIRISRQRPTWIILTNVNAYPPLPPRAPRTLGPNDKGDEDFVVRSSPGTVRDDRTAARVSELPELEARLARIAKPYQNVLVVQQPLLAEGVADAMREMRTTTGPMAAPLSESERKNHQKRAIEALRLMATGVIPGFDVRPAANEIIAATRNDDLAPAAIEATGRLGKKEAQQALAEVVLATARPAAIRRRPPRNLFAMCSALGHPILRTRRLPG